MNLESIKPVVDGGVEFHYHAVIETPRNTRHKFAYDPECGAFKLRSTLAEGLTWPYDYGFIPQTLADDGDPLDVLVLVDEPTFAGCVAEVRLLGSIALKKNGTQNDRLVAAPVRHSGIAQSADPFDDIGDIPKKTVESLCRFLIEYSEEAGNDITFEGTRSRRDARKSMEEAMEKFRVKPQNRGG